MTRTILVVCTVALLVPAVALPQPATLTLPFGVPREGAYDMGLLSRAASLIGAKSLMAVGRELSPGEQKKIAIADDVGAILGATGRNYLGPISSLAREEGIFQEAVRAMVAGDLESAERGFFQTLRTFPDAKIVHLCIAEVLRARGDDLHGSVGHRAMALGDIPPEDLIFMGLVTALEASPSTLDTALPDDLSTPGDMEPSMATLARGWAGLVLMGEHDLALRVKTQVMNGVGTDEGETIPYPELAAAAVVELGHEAYRLMSLSSDPGHAQAVRDNLMMASIAACDGQWADRCVPLLKAASAEARIEPVKANIAAAGAIANAVARGEHWQPQGAVSDELPITTQLASR